jgi:hypothetical protein
MTGITVHMIVSDSARAAEWYRHVLGAEERGRITLPDGRRDASTAQSWLPARRLSTSAPSVGAYPRPTSVPDLGTHRYDARFTTERRHVRIGRSSSRQPRKGAKRVLPRTSSRQVDVFHGVGGEATVRSVCESITTLVGGVSASLPPDEARAVVPFADWIGSRSVQVATARTREALAWTPAGPTVTDDVEHGSYRAALEDDDR